LKIPLVLFLGLLLRQQTASAQMIAGSLRGTVLDSASRQPVGYATVVLLPPAPATQPVAGTTTDAQGTFVLAGLAAGEFRVQVSFVGYGTRARPVAVSAGVRDIGEILLPAAAQQLGEAVVVGRKPLVEVRPDRLVYNAGQDASNAGGTATDVLRKAPLLTVDGQGNVQLRGSTNFRVLVNDKPSPTLASNLAQALKSFPADQIQSVEVITTPSAKYDGEGTAGIINIVLKKSAERGLSGRLGASGGNREADLTSALNFQTNKIGLTAAASTGAWYNPSQNLRHRLGVETLGLDTLTQHADQYNRGTWYNGSLGLDYDPAPHHRLSLAGTVTGYRGTVEQTLYNRFGAPDPTANELFARATTTRSGGLNVEGTGTYTRTFDQARKEWSVLAQYALADGLFGYDFDEYRNSAVPLEASRATRRERSQGRTPGREYTVQSDFTQPLGEKNSLELGLKAIFRRTGSVATVDTLVSVPGARFAPAPGRATDFSYAQDVQAAYATYTLALGEKLTATLGSRLERTALAADFRASGTSLPARSYLTLLPNGHAQYAFTEATSLRAAYSRRITRPYIDYLNPFVDRSDAKNLVYGNPSLDPELTDSYELSYSTTHNSTTLNVAASGRHTGNAIELIRLATADPSITTQTYANVATNAFYQLSFYASTNPLPKWDLSGGLDGQYIVRRSAVLNTGRRGATAVLSFNTSYAFDKGWTALAYGSGSLPTPQLQGRGPASLDYALGAKKSLFQEKADLTLNLTNPFNAYFPYRTTTTTPAFDEFNEYRSYERAVRLSFSYRFGAAQQARERKQISNDDQKTGGNKHVPK
jgi:outer membrane receptor protein involved in Fe transport